MKVKLKVIITALISLSLVGCMSDKQGDKKNKDKGVNVIGIILNGDEERMKILEQK